MMSPPGESAENSKFNGSRDPFQRPGIETMSVEALRMELSELRERERLIIELIGAKTPDRLLHDLRNVLNEVQLLRILAEQSNS